MWKWLWGPNLVTKADRLGTYAAALAYCFVLSLVPFFIVTFVVGLHLTLELDINSDYYRTHYAEVLGNIIPSEEDAKNIVATVTNVEGRKGWLFIIGLFVALYTSYNLMEQILRTLLFIFDDPRKPNSWSWLGVVKTVGLLLIWMCLLLLVSVSAVEAAILRQILYDFLHLEAGGKMLATASQLLIIIAALFGTIFVTYYVAPAKRHRASVVVEGSLLASLGWILCSLIFAKVMPQLLKTSAAYLALGSVVAILLWAQACAWSIILGACWIVRFSQSKK
ncbi:MAG TPA: YihY/virulence factor BrkB family protein [Candidatus Methylacidiphilales bacterium]|jgi:YihY family inner membrane protein|nr:YihY/virulence factor BrkB family protein [Candidatus Methylacidiphilales bacterium]